VTVRCTTRIYGEKKVKTKEKKERALEKKIFRFLEIRKKTTKKHKKNQTKKIVGVL